MTGNSTVALREKVFSYALLFRLVRSLERLGRSISRNPEAPSNLKAVAPQVALLILKRCGPFNGSSFFSKSMDSEAKEDSQFRPEDIFSLPIDQEFAGKTKVSIKVPVQGKSGTSCERPIRVVVNIFQGDELFQNGVESPKESTVNSRVISASVFQQSSSGEDEKAKLAGDVEISFSPLSVSSDILLHFLFSLYLCRLCLVSQKASAYSQPSLSRNQRDIGKFTRQWGLRADKFT